jgi:hypothetical protein
MITVTLEDNRGNQQTVELDGIPSKGDKIEDVQIGTGPNAEMGTVSVKEVKWIAGGGIVVWTVDGFVAR